LLHYFAIFLVEYIRQLYLADNPLFFRGFL
jgi:hypothetical protein